VSVIESAQAVIAEQQPRLLEFGVSDEDAWSVGLACGGRIRVWVEPLTAAKRAIVDELLQVSISKLPRVLAIRLSDAEQRFIDPASPDPLAQAAADALRADKAASLALAEGEIFLLPVNPPLRLIIVGAVHIAESLIQIAGLAGYESTVIDPRQAFARTERFVGTALLVDWPDVALHHLALDARTAVVALTHDPKIDDPALRTAVQSPAFYVGALGSTRTHERRRARLQEQGLSAQTLQRIHGPVGLNIGARSPAEIAISIVAQMTSVLRQREP
jgi:xanthine dehydrogenase accessory factor